MSATGIEDGDVDEKPCPCLARCPDCGGEFRLWLLTVDGFWGLRVQRHGVKYDDKGRTVECGGSQVTIKKGKIK